MNQNNNYVTLLEQCSNNHFSNKGIQWFSKENILICSYKNKNEFSNFALTLKMIYVSKVKYQGTWFPYLKNNYTLSNTFINKSIKDHLDHNKPINNVVSDSHFSKLDNIYYKFCLTGISFNSKITLWSHVLNLHKKKTSLHNTHQDNMCIENLISASYFPFSLCIDSEFVDLNKLFNSPFLNIRDRFPLSLTVSVLNTNNYQKNNLSYVFNNSDFQILKKENTQASLIHTPYNNQGLTENLEKSSLILLDKESPLYLTLNYIYKLKQPNMNQNNNYLTLCSPNYVKKDSNFKTCFKIPIYYYFSAKDLRYLLGSFGYKLIEPFLESRRILSFKKNQSVSSFGYIYTTDFAKLYFKIQIIDISGLSSGGGLNELAHLTDVDLVLKKSSILNKENMRETLQSYPKLYLDYAVQDAVHLNFMVCQSWANLIEIYEIFNVSNIPSLFNFSFSNKILNYMHFTAGSNIACFFEQYIYSLDPSIKTTLDLLSIRSDDLKVIEGISMGSTKYLNYLNGHASIAAFVSGGRCANERPYEISFKNGADIDLSSCYGTSIKNLEYPLGIPSVLRPLLDTSTDNEGTTLFLKEPFVGSLKDVMSQYRKKLVPGLWYAVVSTNEPLSFPFDLLISKNISLNNIFKEKTFNESKAVPGEQLILTKEIKNAIITQPLLDIIDKIATRKEKKELYAKIHVKTMVFYDKTLRCNTFQEFNLKNTKRLLKIELSQKNKKKKSPLNKDSIGIGSIKEKPHYWISIPMDNFISVLLNKRKYYQTLFKNTNQNIYNSKQKYIKLVVNMIYGITASRFFNVSNLCFANNITSLARSSVWIMAKSLNFCQSITDGSIYELNRVNYYHLLPQSRKAGFQTLTNQSFFQKEIYLKPLGILKYPDINWENNLNKASQNTSYKESMSKLCDELAFEHIWNFLKYYNLSKNVFPYSVEHKIENFFYRATTLNRGHYALLNIDKNYLFKIRGTQQKEGSDHVPSPIFNILKAKMLGEKAIINNLCYTKTTLIKSKDFSILQNKNPQLDLSLHDTYVYKMTLKIKRDDGKYPTLKNFIASKSKGNTIKDYSYLYPEYFKKEGNSFTLDYKFWIEYHENKKQEMLEEIVVKKRNSKKKVDLIDKVINNAQKCDSFFDPLPLRSLSPAHKQDNEDLSELYVEEVPLLTDNYEENSFSNMIDSDNRENSDDTDDTNFGFDQASE